MENNPKKSKALIITIIAVIILLIIGYLLFKNKDSLTTGTSSGIAKIFNSLSPSNNPKSLETIGPNAKKELAQAGENLQKGDGLVLSGLNANNNPIVLKAGNGFDEDLYGFANQDISSGDLGEIVIDTSGGSNSFWDTFSDFLDDLFNGGGPGDGGSGGPGDGGEGGPGDGTGDGPGEGLLVCSDTIDNDGDGLIDAADPNCHIDGDLNKPYMPEHYSESMSPSGGPGEGFPQCSDTIDNDIDTLVDEADPNCHIDGDLNKPYMPEHYSESTSPTGGDDDYKHSDLRAGKVTPTSTTINTPTTLSSIITNDGDGSTGSSFTSFFTITTSTETPVGGDETITKSTFKKITSKILNKISFISKVLAEEDVELKTVIAMLPGKTSGVATVSYSFPLAKTYYIRACADKSSAGDEGTITETNEDNNCGPWTTLTVSGSLPPALPQCSDKVDNDGDTKIDALDPGCHTDGDATNIFSYNEMGVLEKDKGGLADEDSQCSDKIDNDGDTKIDEKDPGCHLDGDLNKEYIAEHNSELTPPVSGEEENICLDIEQNPLVFTESEKAELAELLRKFYLIAPTLKTEDDISVAYGLIDEYKNFGKDLDGLINQCYSQTASPKFTLTYAKRFGNPWFKATEERGGGIDLNRNIVNDSDLYIDYNNSIYPIDCKLISGYFSGGVFKRDVDFTEGSGLDINFSKGENCDSANQFIKTITGGGIYPSCTIPFDIREFNNGNEYLVDELENAGCKWNEGTRFEDIERYLYVW